MNTDFPKSGTRLNHTSQNRPAALQHSSRGPFCCLMPLLGFIMLTSGCSSFTNATASRQWIDPPAGDVYTNLILIREAALVSGQTISFQDAVVVYAALGNAQSVGPTDIDRKLKRDKDGGYEFSLSTKNSDWISGIFGGIKQGLSWVVDSTLTAVGAASNKL